jgi:nitrogen fixation-related uncharacterized protein
VSFYFIVVVVVVVVVGVSAILWRAKSAYREIPFA